MTSFVVNVFNNLTESNDNADEILIIEKIKFLVIEYPVLPIVEDPKFFIEFPMILMIEWCKTDGVDEDLLNDKAAEKEESIKVESVINS